jgi:solute:Na+ symporter, SSS family
MLELIIIAAYIIFMISIGVLSRRKAKQIDDYFVAGRKGSTVYITGSLLATIIGASATLGMAGLGFSRGLTGAWWLLVGTVGLIILGLFFAKKVRGYGVYTLPQMAGKMYNGHVALASSVFIVIAWIGVIAAQIIATGQIMNSLGIGTSTTWMIICTIVFITYTVLGGQYSVLRTDFVQIIIIFLGIFGGLAFLLFHIGGFHALIKNLPSDRFSFPVSSNFNGISLISMLLLVGSTYIVGPDMYSRIFCAKDANTARKSVLWAAVILIPFAFGITFIGMGASVISPQINADQAFPIVIRQVYPPLISGIVLAALLSAVMSSAVTCLMSASTILNLDIMKRFNTRLTDKQTLVSSKFVMVVLGLIALFLALKLNGIISTIMWAYTIFTTGVIIPIAFGFFRNKLKLTESGALAGIIGGGLTGLLSKVFTHIKYLDIAALAVGILLLFFVSFIDIRLKNVKATHLIDNDSIDRS